MVECVCAKEGGLSELRQGQKVTRGGMLLNEIILIFKINIYAKPIFTTVSSIFQVPLNEF